MDIRTLSFVNLIFLFLYAAIISLNSSFYGKVRGSSWFAWSNLCRGASWFLLTLGTFLPPSLSTIVGDVLLVVGLMLLHRSIAEVLGRSKTAWNLQLALGTVAFLGVSCFTLVYNNHRASLILVSVALAAQMALTSAMLFSGPRRGAHGAAWFTGTVLFCYALLEMTRAIVLFHTSSEVYQVSSAVVATVLVATLLANGGTAFGFMFLAAADLRLELTRQAEHDALTGVLNRRGLKALADRALHAAHRANEPVSAVMLDLDGMKTANDTWGHEYGDAMLCAVAKLLVGKVGRRGAVARLGGDEFVILLPGVAEGGAMELAENLRSAIERLHVPRCHPRASFGVASMTGERWEDTLRKSDQALNQAKSAGRNRVIRYA